MSEVLESVCCTLCSEELLVFLEQLVEGEQGTFNYGELELGLFLALGRGEGHAFLPGENRMCNKHQLTVASMETQLTIVRTGED